MPIGSATSDVHMINIALTAADGSAANWQDPAQMIPLGMNGNPEAFVAAIRTGLPLVNNLRVMFNEHSFNADGSLHPQFERFLAAAAAQGLQLTICYGGGDTQRLGNGDAAHPRLSNAEAFSELAANFSSVSGAWSQMMTWMNQHTAVESAVYGWELMNEPAAYRESIRANGADATYSMQSFVQLYAEHAATLTRQIEAQAAGHILVGGWGYSGDFLALQQTMIGNQTAIDYLRAAVGENLVWSSHFYAGWLGTSGATAPAELQAQFAALYAPIRGDNVLVTEVNVHGTVDAVTVPIDSTDIFAASLDWFGNNGIGLGWYPGTQEGAAHLLYVERNASLTYRHQHALAHALNGYSAADASAEHAGAEALTAVLTTARLRNESYQVTAGEGLFDTATQMGSAFGYGGNDTLTGTDLSNDFLYGGSGQDVISGRQGDDFLFGQTGNDTLLGGDGLDQLFGGAGHDLLDGGAGANLLDGGAGNDVYMVASAADVVNEYANSGIDMIRTTMASLSLMTGRVGQYTHVENLAYDGRGDFVGIGNALNNNISGGRGSDLLTGDAGNDLLRGVGGADTLRGGSGADTLEGGAGADRLEGDDGMDCASYLEAQDRVVVSLSAAAGIAAKGDALGDVFVLIENLQGSNFDDVLFGDQGANVLQGMAGDDELWSGAGRDLLQGGQGADTFIFVAGDGVDVVADFQDGIDTILINRSGLPVMAALGMQSAVQVGADVVISLGAGDQVTVLNTTLAALLNDVIFL